MQRHLSFLLVGLTAIACAEEPAGDKPEFDPDNAVLSGKADSVSNYWTDLRGELAMGQTIEEGIDFPSYYFGRTTELVAGQRFQVELETNRASLVRLYGPATGFVDGLPIFGRPLVRADTRRADGAHRSSFSFEAPADGVYMLAYGPKWVWQADYRITFTCVEGCAAAEACENDWNCKTGEFCGDNGVRCVRAPCDANFNVCQAQVPGGSACTRDGECQAGLACRGGACVAELCGETSECDNGFCGCGDGSCTTSICKDFAKEGESCGGFRMAHLVRHCSPDFACVAPYDIIADIPGHCGEMTTVAEVLTDPQGFDGRFIAVKGVLDANAPYCTKLACSPANPCCNNCGADIRLYDDASQFGTEGIYTSEEGTHLGCGGNECTWADNCAVEPGNHWVAGWFYLEGGMTPRIDIVARYAY